MYVWDCRFTDGYGVNIKTTYARGGYIKNVCVKDSTLTCIILRTKIGCNNDGESAGYLAKISDLNFENLSLTGEYCGFTETPYLVAPIFIDAFDEEEGAIENVQIKRARILPSSLGEHLPNYFNNVKKLTIED